MQIADSEPKLQPGSLLRHDRARVNKADEARDKRGWWRVGSRTQSDLLKGGRSRHSVTTTPPHKRVLFLVIDKYAELCSREASCDGFFVRPLDLATGCPESG